MTFTPSISICYKFSVSDPKTSFQLGNNWIVRLAAPVRRRNLADESEFQSRKQEEGKLQII